MGVLLWIIAWSITPAIEIINFLTFLYINRRVKGFFKEVDKYSKSMALDRDKYGNHNFRAGLNFWFSKGGLNYGNRDTTISMVTGLKFLAGSLSFTGLCFYYLLYAIDFTTWFKGGHCLNAITINK